jgi:hypothetical protein
VTSYALAVADAINTGGEKATTAYAAAFSAAYAGVCGRRVSRGLQAPLLKLLHTSGMVFGPPRSAAKNAQSIVGLRSVLRQPLPSFLTQRCAG